MRWRKRIGEEGVGWLLTKTIEAGREAGVISERSVEAVSVDTTVMEKAIAHPTDARGNVQSLSHFRLSRDDGSLGLIRK